ncbi:AraC family transcriptional regulator [Pedobacter sp. KR3-3]|uniref:AraC family transcriptional regulator n=1 Tax=Pedobacter albus TaxID=3113905 RepID=A0ABU7I547_9SPHI|nr:AraC family transcriptional regulator [Pedobacter sp. KR3-3]MEE1944581.1 AraC family transcriptional regulator [Pedobacter sp. KR3-3]
MGKFGLWANMALLVAFVCASNLFGLFGADTFRLPFLPFLVLAGPFAYLFSLAVIGEYPKNSKVCLHLAIPILLIILSLKLSIFKESFLAEHAATVWLMVCSTVLSIGYLMAVIAKVMSKRHTGGNHAGFLLLLITQLPIAVMANIAGIAYRHDSKNPEGFFVPESTLIVNWLVCLSMALALFRYFTKQLSVKESTEAEQKQYHKSPLTAKDMEEIAKRLLLVADKGIYIDAELSLKGLAKAVQAPIHHVTQTLSMQMKTDFYGFVNGYRVKMACRMLQETDMAIDLIGQECGFNSRATFNRHFRTATGTTPSNYRTGKAWRNSCLA